MAAPGGVALAKLAKQKFTTYSLVLPAPFNVNMGHPHWARAFRPSQISVSLLGLGPDAAGFLSLSPNWYHAKTQKVISKVIYKYIDGICKAISCSWGDWCKQAVLKNVSVNSSIAAGGKVEGPKLGPVISLKGPHNTLMETSYTMAIAEAIGEAWEKWQASLFVPALDWYPAFKMFPGPRTPPTPNLPAMLNQLAQVTAPLTEQVLGTAIIGKLLPKITLGALSSIASGGGGGGGGLFSAITGPIAPHHQALCFGVAHAVDQYFQKWQKQTQVVKVLADGPVPSFAPPPVPAGPVVGGTGNMQPGGFDTAVFDNSGMVKEISGNEGFSDTVYPDPKTGMNDPTVGHGLNLKEQWVKDGLKAQGLDPAKVLAGTQKVTEAQSVAVLEGAIQTATKDARSLFKTFDLMPAAKQEVLVDMAFNMGLNRLGGFKKMIAALDKLDYKTAADEMKNSQWYKDTGNRAKKHIETMKEDPCG